MEPSRINSASDIFSANDIFDERNHSRDYTDRYYAESNNEGRRFRLKKSSSLSKLDLSKMGDSWSTIPSDTEKKKNEEYRPPKPKLSALNYVALSLRDPTTNKRLSDAVTIIPCGCRVNMETMKQIKVVAKEILVEVPPNTPCPACNKPMKWYFEDEHTRTVTREFYLRLAVQRKVLSIPPEPIRKWVGPIPSYPGPRGNFKKTEACCSSVEFGSSNESVVKRVVFTNHPNWRALCIFFIKSIAFENYLWANDIHLTDSDRIHCQYQVTEPNDMRKLFGVILKNNEFRQYQVDKIKNIIHNAAEPVDRGFSMPNLGLFY